MQANLSRKVIVAAIAASFFAAGAWWARSPDAPPAPAIASPVVAAATAVPVQPAGLATSRGLPGFADLVAANGPAVVNITVQSKVEAQGIDPRDPLSQFFGPQNGQRAPQSRIQRGLGSGFIISADGTILTNAHVVDGASTVMVKLTDRREFKAKVIGIDKRTDVAVVKIEASGLPVVKIGNLAESRIGDWVVAIGSPFGFENTVTSGIISAKSRALGPQSNYVNFIQTDVPINPGNSGGPLFNMNGEVIGINSQIFSETGGYMGLSFAIPIDIAMNVEQQLVSTGKVVRGQLGALVQQVSAPTAKSLKLPDPSGALVVKIEPGSAADKAGLQPGDVIRGFGGQKVDMSSDLPLLVASTKPGAKIKLDVWRDGKATTLDAVIGELKESQTAAAESDAGKLGLAVRPLTKDEQREAKVSGLLVEQVQGNAEAAGIEPGDVLLQAGGKSLKTPLDLQKAVKESDGSVGLLVQRDDARFFVPVPLN
ncbi:DegQ family serine endoprotease [Derxia lacustris]|uniref:DegQ family serine endoprotease n=1 Tax=Derxia lacustris TaxID=764842 RepID=UPI000A177D43|nr:DegQ family serine endoprotease [Derxia lacustris]